MGVSIDATDVAVTRITAAELFQGHYARELCEAYDVIDGRGEVYTAALDAYAGDLIRQALATPDPHFTVPNLIAGLASGRAGAEKLAADFQDFVSTRRRVAGQEPFTIEDFWRQVGVDFSVYGELLESMDAVALKISGQGGKIKRADARKFASGVEIAKIATASYQAYIFGRGLVMAEVPEVIIAGAVMARLSHFHIASVETFDASLGAPAYTRFQRELAAYRDPLRAVKELFVDQRRLPYTIVRLPDQLPVLDSLKPIEVQRLLLELVRIAAVASGPEDRRKKIDFHWDADSHLLRVEDRFGVFYPIWEDRARWRRIETLVARMGPGTEIRFMPISSVFSTVFTIQIPPPAVL